jgi:hypothetical protein
MNNFAKISERRLKRKADMMGPSVDFASVLEKAINMGESDREDYIKRFVKQHGIRETFTLVKNLVKSIVASSPAQKTATAQLYEGFRNKETQQQAQQDSASISTRDQQASPSKFYAPPF